MAREFLLRGVDPEEVKPREKVELTEHEKRENWWYYHKVHLLVGLVMAAIVFSFVFSVVTKENPDYVVGLMSSFQVPDHAVEELERCITPYADDRNDDGKTIVHVYAYTVGEQDPATSEDLQMQQANLARFMVDFSSNTSMIFLHDEISFNAVGDDFSGMFEYNDGSPQPEGAKDYENVMRPWSDFAAFKNFTAVSDDEENVPSSAYQDFFETLRVSIRASEGSTIEKKEKDMQYHEDSEQLYQRLLKGEIVQTETAAKE